MWHPTESYIPAAGTVSLRYAPKTDVRYLCVALLGQTHGWHHALHNCVHVYILILPFTFLGMLYVAKFISTGWSAFVSSYPSGGRPGVQ